MTHLWGPRNTPVNVLVCATQGDEMWLVEGTPQCAAFKANTRHSTAANVRSPQPRILITLKSSTYEAG